jgi:methyl-accepting chemotaxis protein
LHNTQGNDLFGMKSISVKLTGAMAAALVSLCIISAIAIYAAHEIQWLGRDLYEQSQRTSTLQMRVSVDIERAISEVHAAPSELDLNRLKASKQRFDTLLDQNRQKLQEGLDDATRSSGQGIAASITAFGEAARKVFELSAAFAQPDAIAALASRVAPAEAAMEDSLRLFHQAADQDEAAKAAVIEATTAMITRLVIGLASLAVVGLSFLAVTVVSRGVVRPIVAIDSVMRRLAGGETTVDIPHIQRADEIGEMARAVEVFKKNTLQTERLKAQQEEASAARSRRQDAMERHAQTFAASVSDVTAKLVDSAEGIRVAATAMATASKSTHASATITSTDAAKASQDLGGVAAAVEELTSSFREISRQVATAAQVSRQAVERTAASEESIRDLSESTGRIGSVVELINNIAGQTNLLALNATIEAARAGEAGKGFAVVAGEVKALAAQTAKATADISSQIDTVRSATNSTITAMTEISGMIGKMDEVATAIATAVEQQSATTREIAASIQSVSATTVKSAQAMTRVVSTADDAGEAGEKVLHAAIDVGTETGTLRAEVDQFLAAVRGDSGVGAAVSARP